MYHRYIATDELKQTKDNAVPRVTLVRGDDKDIVYDFMLKAYTVSTKVGMRTTSDEEEAARFYNKG